MSIVVYLSWLLTNCLHYENHPSESWLGNSLGAETWVLETRMSPLFEIYPLSTGTEKVERYSLWRVV